MTPVEIDPQVLGWALAGVGSVCSGLAAAVVVLWKKVGALQDKLERDEREWRNRWELEVLRGARLYQATPPKPGHGTMPPPPDDEPTGVRNLRQTLLEQDLEDYLHDPRSVRKRTH